MIVSKKNAFPIQRFRVINCINFELNLEGWELIDKYCRAIADDKCRNKSKFMWDRKIGLEDVQVELWLVEINYTLTRAPTEVLHLLSLIA